MLATLQWVLVGGLLMILHLYCGLSLPCWPFHNSLNYTFFAKLPISTLKERGRKAYLVLFLPGEIIGLLILNSQSHGYA